MSRQEKIEDRRKFMKAGVAGLAGMALLSSPLKSDEQKEEEVRPPKAEAEKKFIYRTLGKTGIKLPIVSMGAHFNEPDMISAALDAGIVHIDTANVYANGRHEEAIGQALKGRKRDSVVIGTKVYLPVNEKTGLYPKDAKPELFNQKFEESLKRLGLEYVDILYLHSVSKKEAALFEPFLTALTKQKKAGKTRFIGVSTHTNEPEVIHATVDSKVYDVVLTSYNFLQPHLAEMEAAIQRAAKAGIGIVAMKTQAGIYWDKERKQKINMKAALKWALKNEHIHTAIPGFSTFEEMELDLSVMENLTLTAEEKKDLKLGQEKKMAGLYCRQCRKCVAQCKADVEIPTLMRSYMYAYGYKNLRLAKEAVRHMDLKQIPCSSCSPCSVSECSMGFAVREKVLDIARIENVPDDFIA